MIKLLLLIVSLNADLPADSLGIETINGQTFVIHRVEEKETLFGISRRYGSTVDDILRHNSGAGAGLEIGQILKVPFTAKPVRKPSDGMVHTVVPKETLYSIARTYQVSMEDIKRWNNLPDNNLSVGQELTIRRPGPVAVRAPQPIQHNRPEPVSRKGTHTVQPGQTLFSLSREYNVSVDQLKEWNGLDSNELKIGQTLYVAQPERGGQRNETARVEEAPPVVREPVSSSRPQQESAATENTPERNAPVTRNSPPASRPEDRGQSAESIRISESLKNGDEIIEGGLAELIEGTEGNRKYLALHRSAPMGTILKVRNEMNNREVFVRVMGKLPDTAMTDKLIIKISRSAYDRLGAIDPRFRVEVTYYK